MSRSWPSAAALILAVAARSCSRRRRVRTSGPEASTSSSGLWSCSVGEAPTTGDKYLRAQHSKASGRLPGLPCPPPLPTHSPASPNASPAGCRLLRDVRCHTGVPTHSQGQPGPEASHPAQPLTKLPNLCGRQPDSRLSYNWTSRPRPSCIPRPAHYTLAGAGWCLPLSWAAPPRPPPSKAGLPLPGAPVLGGGGLAPDGESHIPETPVQRAVHESHAQATHNAPTPTLHSPQMPKLSPTRGLTFMVPPYTWAHTAQCPPAQASSPFPPLC